MLIIKQSISIIIIAIVFLMPELKAQPSDLVLNNMTVATTETYNATNSITAGPNFTITGSGDVTFATPNVKLLGDFVIQSGGKFAIVNDVVDEIETMGDLVLPTKFVLYQNYPNPFNPTTSIKYHIPELSFVTLKVYDVLGNELAVLVNEEKQRGSYEIEFDATELSSGIYFYLLRAGSFAETKKMVFMK